MIDSISNIPTQQIFNSGLLDPTKGKKLSFPNSVEFPSGVAGVSKPKAVQSFDSLVGKLVNEVDEKNKAAVAESNKVLLGETDNLHQAMISMQEAGLAFSTMVEVRNKLVQSYQELMRMPV